MMGLDRSLEEQSGGRVWRTRARHALNAWVESPLYPLSLVVALLLIWQFVVAGGYVPGIPTTLLGSPSEVYDAFLNMAVHGYDGTPLIVHVGASVARALTGFFLGALVAIPLGLLMGYNRVAGNLLLPIFAFLRPIPALAFIPVVTIWFGIGETSKVLVIFWTSFIYAVLGASLGVKAAPRDYLRVAANYQLSGTRTLFTVLLPAALPQIIVSLRTAMALSWAVVITAELIAAQQGLGFLIEDASNLFLVNDVYVGLFFIGVIGITIEFGFRYLERRVLHWQGQ